MPSVPYDPERDRDRDLFAVLGVPWGAAPEEVRQGWRAVSQAAHPDRGGSHEAFVEAQHAWEVLSDPHRRAQYVRAYEARHGRQQGRASSGAEERRSRARTEAPGSRFCAGTRRDGTPCGNLVVPPARRCRFHQTGDVPAHSWRCVGTVIFRGRRMRCLYNHLIGQPHCWDHATEAERRDATARARSGGCAAVTQRGQPCRADGSGWDVPLCIHHVTLDVLRARVAAPSRPGRASPPSGPAPSRPGPASSPSGPAPPASPRPGRASPPSGPAPPAPDVSVHGTSSPGRPRPTEPPPPSRQARTVDPSLPPEVAPLPPRSVPARPSPVGSEAPLRASATAGQRLPPPLGHPTPTIEPTPPSRPPPPEAPTRPRRRRSVVAAVAVLAMVATTALGVWHWRQRPRPIAFSEDIKATSAACESDRALEADEVTLGVTLRCVMVDAAPGNRDRPYVQLRLDGCEDWRRLDHDDGSAPVVVTVRLEPCGAIIQGLNWQVCQTHGGPLPDDCVDGREELPSGSLESHL